MSSNLSQPEAAGGINDVAASMASGGTESLGGSRDAGSQEQTGLQEQAGSHVQSGLQGQAGSQAQSGLQGQAGSQAQSGLHEQAGAALNTRSIEKKWFWIALFSLFNSFYTASATQVYFEWATEIEEHIGLIKGFALFAAAAGVLAASLLLKPSGPFDSPRSFKSAFFSVSCVGTASMVIFAVICNTIVPEVVWPAFIFQCIATAVPAFTAGCAMQRMVKTINVKAVATFSGLIVVITLLSTVAHVVFLNIMASWRATETSYVVIYIALLAVPAILLATGKGLFAYTAPESEAYFPEPLHKKFLVLSVVFLALNTFYDSSYYAGGDFESFSLFFVAILFFLPNFTAAATTLLLRIGKWRSTMLAITLFVCFQQGLALFFNDNETLAAVYAIMDTFSICGVIFTLFIPITLSTQRRKSAAIACGLLSLFFVGSSVPEFISEFPGQAFSGIIAPSVTFSLSIAAIAYLFYLFGEHNVLRTEELMKTIGDLRKSIEEEKLASDKAMRNAGFTEDETKVALLLIDGGTQRDIARKFHMSAADASRAITDIREKISGISDRDPSVTAVVKKFKLTGRETHMLVCLRDGKTNPQIADELIISEATVKNHVHNLMKKLPVDGRQNIRSWLETVGSGAE